MLYRAHVKWTEEDSRRVRQADVDWPVEVRNVVAKDRFTVILLHGFPNDLAWYQPNLEPSEHAIVQVGSVVYHLRGELALQALNAAQNATDPEALRNLLVPDDLWFELPLSLNASFCSPDHLPAQGTMLCWHVEKTVPVTESLYGAMGAKAQAAFQLVYQTNPDSETYVLAPGLGVTRYVYLHHGTAAEVDAELTAVKGK